MTHEHYVSLEVAKLLREDGFNWGEKTIKIIQEKQNKNYERKNINKGDCLQTWI